MAFLVYPYLLVTFWYIEAPFKILRFFGYLNIYLLHLLSVPLFFRTFFKPAKLEYRKGLIGFSIAFGMLIKSVLLFTDLVIFVFVLILEIVFFVLFLVYPILPIIFIFR